MSYLFDRVICSTHCMRDYVTSALVDKWKHFIKTSRIITRFQVAAVRLLL